jgi:DeoR family galactitol utilization operon repressor
MKRKDKSHKNGVSDRRQFILDQLMEQGSVSVSGLSEELGVTQVTARADLAALEMEGMLVRTHGGATPAHHPKVFERIQTGRRRKEKIARAAAEMIQDGDTVIISAGTTTAMIPKYLLGRRDVHIVTNNTLLLNFARNNAGLHITLIGGEFRASEEGMVGPMALAALDQFHVSKTFIGIDGASVKQGFTAYFLESAVLVRKMAEQADQVIAIGHSSKFGKHGFARILPFDGVDVMVTDTDLDQKIEAEMSDAGVNVVKA